MEDIVAAWESQESRRGFVLNDFTRADLLLFADGNESGAGVELGTAVQVKTTAGAKTGNSARFTT